MCLISISLLPLYLLFSLTNTFLILHSELFQSSSTLLHIELIPYKKAKDIGLLLLFLLILSVVLGLDRYSVNSWQAYKQLN